MALHTDHALHVRTGADMSIHRDDGSSVKLVLLDRIIVRSLLSAKCHVRVQMARGTLERGAALGTSTRPASW